MRKLGMLFCVALLAFATTGCETGSAQRGAGAMTPVPILGQFEGEDSGLTTPGISLINSQQQLVDLGANELAQAEVDYDSNSLLVLSLGEQPTGGYWAQITGVQKSGNALYVQGVANRPAEDAATTQALTYPYSAVVIPKAQAEVIYSEIDSLVGQEPEAAAAEPAE